MPSGARVRIDGRSVNIYPSSVDWLKTVGLCGTFTKMCEDDFLRSDGQLSWEPGTDEGCDRQQGEGSCFSNGFAPNGFSDSWR